MQVGDLFIPADVEVILEKLKGETGIPRSIKPTGRNVMIPCPYHKGGMERKPSCGILTEDVWAKGKLYKEGQVHCFTCGHTVDFIEFVSDAFGKTDGGREGYRWLVKNFLTIEIEERQKIKVDMSRTKEKNRRQKTKLEFISEEELAQYRFYHDYMFERKLDEDVIELFDVGYDRKEKAITFPVHYHKNGKVLMIQRRSVISKFFKNPGETQKTLTLYGLWQVQNAIANGVKIDKLYITESIIDALTIWVYGGYAISLMGLGGFEQYDILKNIPGIRAYVLALDNDSAGWTAMDKLKEAINGAKLLYEFPFPRKVNDINEMSYEQFIKADSNLKLF